MSEQSRTLAVLGPTNTGKTHFAIERMLGYRTGLIGLPLRLLAREVYDRIVAVRGPSVVALVTGEERIVPARAQYWVCTVEAMPEGMGTDFVAIDEIQLCADPERGHVFTDRLLRLRGQHETQFLGSHTMRGVIANLVRNARQAIVNTGTTGRITVTADEDTRGWIIRIHDTGPGLPPKAREHLFKPFQGGATKGGTGLGLTIAAELVHGHGGLRSLEQSDPWGTVFCITLPKGNLGYTQ